MEIYAKRDYRLNYGGKPLFTLRAGDIVPADVLSEYCDILTEAGVINKPQKSKKPNKREK